jgi:L-alanine-DL-glutamate epimerase-like enolase superfamily enzyme
VHQISICIGRPLHDQIGIGRAACTDLPMGRFDRMALVITGLLARSVRIPINQPLTTSRHAGGEAYHYVVVQLRLSDGTQGFGEAMECAHITGETHEGIVAAVNRHFAPVLLGCELADIGGLHRAMAHALIGNTAAKSAVDLAAYDALGRALGVPVSVLLGGGPRGPVVSSKAVGAGSTEAMVAEAQAYVAEGFHTLKLKVGLDEAAELAAVGAIRKAVGPEIRLKLDANQGWNLPEATRFLARVERHGIEVIEQPLPAWDMAGCAELRRRTPIPVMLDEAVHTREDAMRAVELRACDYINIKLVKTGGLLPALDLCAVAEAAGIPCQIGTLSSSIGTAAAVHLVHARPNIVFAEIGWPGRLAFDLATGYRIEDGAGVIAPGAGLGLDVNADALTVPGDLAAERTRP